jgi:hypothetical protein
MLVNTVIMSKIEEGGRIPQLAVPILKISLAVDQVQYQ